MRCSDTKHEPGKGNQCGLDFHSLACGRLADMTNQHTNQQQRPRHHEDYKVQRLIERIETKLAEQAKTVREAKQASSKN
jgi:hypothetical protein